MHHAFALGDAEHGIELSRSAAAYRLYYDDKAIEVKLVEALDGHARLTVDGQSFDVVMTTRGDEVFIHFDGETYALRYQHPLDRLAAQAHGGADEAIRAPMPGSVISVAVTVGETVTRGQTLLVMESMKMETTIIAPRDGVVHAVNFEKGQTFDRDAVLLELQHAD